jgi:hypothetical protein
MEQDKSHAIAARVVGSTIFFYIATSITGTIVFARITEGQGIAAKLANIAQHSPQLGLSFLLAMLTIFEALILAVALYVLTRSEHADLALFALTCRVVEGVLNAIPAIVMLALLSVAVQAGTAAGSDAVALGAVGSSLLELQGWSTTVSAPVFGVGSAIYYYLFACAGSIPRPLAWFGVLSSALLVVAIPLEGVQIITGALGFYVWLPSLLFELIFAPWLLIKGVAARAAA